MAEHDAMRIWDDTLACARGALADAQLPADALAAILNPTVNSYKRINAPRTVSGATWSPSSVTYSGNNRTRINTNSDIKTS